MLQLKNIQLNYGHIEALRGISLDLPEGKVVSLLGANGAGKSSVLKVASGLLKPNSGQFKLGNEVIHKASTSWLVKSGVIHCPEGRRVFPEFTVEENLMIGAFRRRDKPNIQRDLDRVFIYFPRLKERVNQKASTLSGGEQQMLAIGRSLLGSPKYLLLDEPSLGIAPKLVKEIFNILKAINEEGTSLLLVEQNAHMALAISDYSYVLVNGKIKMEGPSDQVKEDPSLKELYLGG